MRSVAAEGARGRVGGLSIAAGPWHALGVFYLFVGIRGKTVGGLAVFFANGLVVFGVVDVSRSGVR